MRPEQPLSTFYAYPTLITYLTHLLSFYSASLSQSPDRSLDVFERSRWSSILICITNLSSLLLPYLIPNPVISFSFSFRFAAFTSHSSSFTILTTGLCALTCTLLIFVVVYDLSMFICPVPGVQFLNKFYVRLRGTGT